MNLVRLSYRGGGANIEPYTVIVTLDENFENKDVFLSQIGQETLKKTCLAPDYTVEFKPMHDGVWTITTETIDGRPISVDTEPLLAWGTYSYVIESGFDFQEWLTRGRVTQTFATLDDVLADEKTVRQLMTVHDSVDYLVDALDNGDDDLRDKLLASDNALKWIGISDYAYDQFDNELATFINSWLVSDKWEYALNSHVPVMTADNAPYGNVTRSNVYSDKNADGYLAFDGDDTTNWAAKNTTNEYLAYEFTNPTKVSRVFLKERDGRVKNFRIEASNDGTFTDVSANPLYTGIKSSTNVPSENYIDIPTSKQGYYKHYRVFVVDNYSSVIAIYTLQFYGRQLKVSVPKMDGNNSPYGEASCGSSWGGNEAYMAFDQDSSTLWCSDNLVNPHAAGSDYLQYDFKKPTVVKAFSITINPNMHLTSIEILGSNDGTHFEPIYTYNNTVPASGSAMFSFDNDIPYSIYRVICNVVLDYSTAGRMPQVKFANFYGIDYSEKEFSADGKVEYIYDHGVELMNLHQSTSASTDIVEKLPSSLHYKSTSSVTVYCGRAFAANEVNAIRMRIGEHLTGNNTMGLDNGSSVVFGNTISTNALPNEVGINVLNAVGNLYIFVRGTSTAECDIVEWWLEK